MVNNKVLSRSFIFCAIFSLILVINDHGGFWRFSPAIFGSLFLFILRSLEIIFKLVSKRLVSRRDLILYCFAFCSITVSYITYDFHLELRAVGRIIYILGCLIAIEYVDRYSLHRSVFSMFIVAISTDMLLRLFFAFPSTEMYDYKMSFILVDTNFIAQLLLVSLLPFVWRERLWSIVLLVFTFSRSVFLVSFVYLFGIWRVVIIAAVFIVFLLFWPNFDLENLDGSLATKIDIFRSFLLVINHNALDLFFGYGKYNVQLELFNLGYLGTVGHTVFGLALEIGVIAILLVFASVNYSIIKGFRLQFWLIIVLVGSISLYPQSYLGLFGLVYHCSLYVRGVRTGGGNF